MRGSSGATGSQKCSPTRRTARAPVGHPNGLASYRVDGHGAGARSLPCDQAVA